ncbi:hypothetical protein C6Y45_12160 [Alkalicoccus saliphilus]|uniref:Uncharacterized protein n=1 Tax=Alkalicoccus saliphilus TaxID=200989 RepID=A0A2T4U4F0_9BACI|nr:hypothetical protein C6Y45_12160 [Alkalicoccus saliphilus]
MSDQKMKVLPANNKLNIQKNKQICYNEHKQTDCPLSLEKEIFPADVHKKRPKTSSLFFYFTGGEKDEAERKKNKAFLYC